MQPTNRCFKGLSIVFFIYGSGSLLAGLMISQITRAHIDNTNQNPTVAIPEDKEAMRKHAKEITYILLLTGSIFWSLSLGMFALKYHYRNNKGRPADNLDRIPSNSN